MNYKCEVCHDSGSKNQTGDYLDCPACDMPMIRKSLTDFVKSLGPKHPEDVALAIHQRALAMAPKQEAPEPVYQDCGACNGSGWVSRDADIGTEQECFSCDGSGKSDDAAPTISTAALTEEQVVCALGCIANGRNAGYISTENAKVVREFIRAAPAAANGALTDAQIQQAANDAVKRGDLSWLGFDKDDQGSYTIPVLSKSHFQFARAILAAAGPDAALMAVLGKAYAYLHGRARITKQVTEFQTCQYLSDEIRAALSGAKGN